MRNARSGDVTTTIAATTGVAEAARLMKRHGVDALVVAYDDGEPGILTERDLVRHLSRRTGDAQVGTVASRPLVRVDNDLDMLQFDGCDQGQGYYFSRPLSTNDFAAICRSPSARRTGTLPVRLPLQRDHR